MTLPLRTWSWRAVLTLVTAAGLGQAAVAQDQPLPVGQMRRLSAADATKLHRALQPGRSGSPDWRRVLEIYFGNPDSGGTFRGDLPDLVAYVDASGQVYQGLLRSGRPVTKQVLRGQKYLYVLLFSEGGVVRDTAGVLQAASCSGTKTTAAGERVTTVRATPSDSVRRLGLGFQVKSEGVRVFRGGYGIDSILTLDSSGVSKIGDSIVGLQYTRRVQVSRQPPGPSVNIRRTAVNYQTDPVVVKLLTGFSSKLFGGGAATPERDETRDTSQSVPLTLLTPDGDFAICSAAAKIPLPTNMDGRIAIEPDSGYRFPKTRRLVTNFMNSSASWFSVGFGLGATAGRTRKASLDTLSRVTVVDTLNDNTIIHRDSVSTRRGSRLSGSGVNGNLFFVLHVMVIRPALPTYPTGLGFFAGTNIASGSPFGELVTGVVVTRVLGDIGLLGGCNWLETQNSKGKQSRDCYGFVGLDIHL